MNRVIKFRVWDEQNKVMHDNNEIVVYLGRCWLENASFDPESIHINPDVNLISMQFTGLTDKNGVDIYESDLVKVWHGGKPAKGVGTVIFSHGYVGGWVLTTDNNDSLNIGTRTKDIEVVGNIYENKDLIEVNK